MDSLSPPTRKPLPKNYILFISEDGYSLLLEGLREFIKFIAIYLPSCSE
tara:strand:- start:2357 stop:2503 length:147 start_codon:yes stop_codon:yes gene_type:complete